MPGAMRKMGVYLGLVEDDEYADGDGDGARPSAGRPRRVRRCRATPAAATARIWLQREYQPDDEQAYGQDYTEAEYPSYRITTLHPRTYNEARTIGEHFRKSTPVIMNLSEMDDADAKRLVDFAAGPHLRPARAASSG